MLENSNQCDDEAKTVRRVRQFGLHLLGSFVVMGGLVSINLIFMPESIWFPLPIVLWGAPLAVHAAWAMGLFDGMITTKGQG